MDELDAEQLAYQAKEVRLLLAHAALPRAFKATEDRIKRQWEAAPDPPARELCYAKLQAFKDLKTELRALAERALAVPEK